MGPAVLQWTQDLIAALCPQVAAAFPQLELQAHAALRACLEQQQQQQQQLAAAMSLSKAVESLSSSRFHLLLPALNAVAALHLGKHLKNCLGGPHLQGLHLRALCCFFADVFDPSSPGLSVLLMQQALEAMRLRAEPLGAPEALLLLRGIRQLQ
ncbi:hypothetical protein ETH_00025065, partial [Eimeria tenella]